MAIVLGLLAALLWGTGDFLARFVGQAIGPWRTLFWIGVIGLVILTAWFLATGNQFPATANEAGWHVWLVALLAGLLHFAGSYALTHALTIGQVSLVTPISTSYGAVATLLSMASGETLSALTLLGVVVTTAGVVLASAKAPSASGDYRSGVRWALVSALAFGIAFWAQGTVMVPVLGGLESVWVFLVIMVAVMAGCRLLGFGKLAPPLPSSLLMTGACALFSAGATAAIALGYETGHVAVVSVLSTGSSVVAVFLGATFLGERLLRRQALGVAIIVAGVAAIRLGM
jgi:drug/metabolite transporter (DMT)-like permease